MTTIAPALLLALLVGGAGAGGVDVAVEMAQAVQITMQGRNLTPAEAEALEQVLAQDPEDANARLKLIGFYANGRFRNAAERDAHARHVVWFIEHRPEHAVTSSPMAMLLAHEPPYRKARRLWSEQVEKNPENVRVLSNAAQFTLVSERAWAIELFERCEALDPENPHWPERLGQAHSMAAHSIRGGLDPEAAALAYEAYMRALRKTPDPARRYYMLDSVAWLAAFSGRLDEAERLARELLDGTVERDPDWNFGNAIHKGNLVLGLAALRSDDVEKAEEYLIRAGKTPGSPQLNSFGPNMVLAKELLDRGRTEAVIEYLKLCGTFWQQAVTDRWIATIEAGGMPAFGANLRY